MKNDSVEKWLWTKARLVNWYGMTPDHSRHQTSSGRGRRLIAPVLIEQTRSLLGWACQSIPPKLLLEDSGGLG
jgi:hypothetical protein